MLRIESPNLVYLLCTTAPGMFRIEDGPYPMDSKGYRPLIPLRAILFIL